MGGHAFEREGLWTPRIAPATYQLALEEVEQKLSQLFNKVAHCIEAPEKRSYGDLDVLVLPHSDAPIPSPEEIAKHLNAKSWAAVGTEIHSYAIAWPKSAPAPTFESLTSQTESLSLTETSALSCPPQNIYIQLDLRICTSQIDFSWRLFSHAHGDLINILSTILRPRGLTLTDRGLYLRIKDYELQDRKFARIELTRSPSLVLSFVGLDESRYYTPFSTLDEMMSYIATCRFHDPRLFDRVDYELGDPQSVEDKPNGTLNKRDVGRIGKRPAFAYWVRDFLPRRKCDEPGDAAHLSREEVLQEVFKFFGDDIRRAYCERKVEVEVKIGKANLWNDVKARVLESGVEKWDVHETVKALKREVIPTERSEKLTAVQKAYTEDDFTAVIAWAVENHEAALRRYRVWLEGRLEQPLDETKTNKFSTSDKETYSADDNERVLAMKQEGKSWREILQAIGKRRRSQLQAHYKQSLADQENRR